MSGFSFSLVASSIVLNLCKSSVVHNVGTGVYQSLLRVQTYSFRAVFLKLSVFTCGWIRQGIECFISSRRFFENANVCEDEIFNVTIAAMIIKLMVGKQIP